MYSTVQWVHCTSYGDERWPLPHKHTTGINVRIDFTRTGLHPSFSIAMLAFLRSNDVNGTIMLDGDALCSQFSGGCKIEDLFYWLLGLSLQTDAGQQNELNIFLLSIGPSSPTRNILTMDCGRNSRSISIHRTHQKSITFIFIRKNFNKINHKGNIERYKVLLFIQQI